MDLWVSSRTENGWGSPVNLKDHLTLSTWITVFIFQAIIGKLLTGLQHVLEVMALMIFGPRKK